ncbi:MAG: NAD(P)-dependent oxidoreductase [Sphingomonadales bacterium]|nr:NAD(P)-dependent oxidoreductase [Sphingomonadales bacterium]MDE2168354.1 NAD(P)-dependent oxidoreductase [Sphingomonadales bacterium]
MPVSLPRIALTGGSGFVGQALLDEAAKAGVEARALARRAMAPRAGVDWLRGDLDDRKALAHLMRDAEAVIHVAGVVNTPEPEEFFNANVVGTLTMLEEAIKAGVRRFVYVSSLSAREPELSTYGASKALAEQLVKTSGLDWTIVRPPAIYGPRDREMFELFRAARFGVLPMPAGGRASIIHVEDLARLLIALIPGQDLSTAQTYEPDDGLAQGWAHDDLARAIGAAMGKRVRVMGLSGGLMRLGASIDTRLRGAKAKLTADRVGYMMHPDWVASPEARVPGSLWAPRIETRVGLAATAEWYRREGWL